MPCLRATTHESRDVSSPLSDNAPSFRGPSTPKGAVMASNNAVSAYKHPRFSEAARSPYPNFSVERRAGTRSRTNSSASSHVPSSHLVAFERGRISSMPNPHHFPAASVASTSEEERLGFTRFGVRVPFPRDVDNESYRLAKACGQDVLSASTSSPAGWAIFKSEDPASQPLARHTSLASRPPIHVSASPHIHSPAAPSPSSPRPRPPRFPHPPTIDVLRSLEVVLGKQHLQLHEYINPDDLYEEVREKKDNMRMTQGTGIRVFGTAVTELNEFAMCITTHGKFQYELPTTVVTCVEQLYRTGIYQVDLFRALPNRPQLQHLVDQFDHPSPSSTPAPSLSHEPIPNICALLHRYITALPTPLTPRNIFDALWVWCVLPTSPHDLEVQAAAYTRSPHHGSPSLQPDGQETDKRPPTGSDHYRARGVHRDHSEPRQRRARSASSPRRLSLPALGQARTPRDETPQLAIARHLLLLLPPRCFALLSYLFSFFSQLPLSPANGMMYDDVSRLFAPALLGGPRYLQQQEGSGGGRANKGEGAARLVMVWLLCRWSVLLDAFDDMEGFDEIESAEGRSPRMGLEGSLFESEGERNGEGGRSIGLGIGRPSSRGGLPHPSHRRTVSDHPLSTGDRRITFSDPFCHEAQDNHKTEVSTTRRGV